MNHLPFEDWLLNSVPITLEQQHELDLHLRDCSYCAALAETGRLLNSARMAMPTGGFTTRFQLRLAERKLMDRRKRIWGSLLFTVGGLTLLLWFLQPYLLSFLSSPAGWVSAAVSWLVFIGTTIFALFEAGLVILSVLPNFMPPFIWMMIISTVAGVTLLWSVSIWRFAQRGAPRGV